MHIPMATRAEGNQVFSGIITESAASLPVMDLKVLRCTTALAAPAISLEHFFPQPAVAIGIKLAPRPLGSQSWHHFPPDTAAVAFFAVV